MLKQNFWWAWSMWAGRPMIDRIGIRDVQYQFEVNRCRNEEVNLWGLGWGRARNFHSFLYKENCPASNLTFDPGFQGSSANSVGGDSGQDGRTDGRDNHNIPMLLKAWG
ncbi:hypothetical protein DPMN_162550 [Dreissena polymorpha]|uniref:Uncharacterized protein n=1 Tax=Dreissena polymorpha TaxID=45954 RepID=A0A9D4EV32_DREPO|nr:hypothetical protein DPMN_162550 [Dreissena polymorpha]